MITYYVLYIFMSANSTWHKYPSFKACKDAAVVELAKNPNAKMKCLRAESRRQK